MEGNNCARFLDDMIIDSVIFMSCYSCYCCCHYLYFLLTTLY